MGMKIMRLRGETLFSMVSYDKKAHQYYAEIIDKNNVVRAKTGFCQSAGGAHCEARKIAEKITKESY